MKRLLYVRPSDRAVDFALLITRISLGLMMLTHGLPKLGKLMGPEPAQFMDFMGLGPGISLGLTVFAEVICSIMLILGLGTRFAALPLLITMLVAAFIAHGADPFGKKEMSLLYATGYSVLLLLGSGRYAADALLARPKARREAARMPAGVS